MVKPRAADLGTAERHLTIGRAHAGAVPRPPRSGPRLAAGRCRDSPAVHAAAEAPGNRTDRRPGRDRVGHPGDDLRSPRGGVVDGPVRLMWFGGTHVPDRRRDQPLTAPI